MKTTQDKKLLDHNNRQKALMSQMIHNERWYLSEELGWDCTETKGGRKILRDRIDSVILDSGFGAWMNEEIEK